jgi:hypothetical protein
VRVKRSRGYVDEMNTDWVCLGWVKGVVGLLILEFGVDYTTRSRRIDVRSPQRTNLSHVRETRSVRFKAELD